jgi:hypothetical protein
MVVVEVQGASVIFHALCHRLPPGLEVYVLLSAPLSLVKNQQLLHVVGSPVSHFSDVEMVVNSKVQDSSYV